MPSYVKVERIDICHVDGSTCALSLKPAMRSDSTLMVGSLLWAGCDIGYQPEWCVDDDLKLGKLVRLLPDHQI